MTKYEAARIVRGLSWIGEFHPGDSVTLDGDFTVKQLEAIIVLMKVAEEEDAQVDVDALAADQSSGDT